MATIRLSYLAERRFDQLCRTLHALILETQVLRSEVATLRSQLAGPRALPRQENGDIALTALPLSVRMFNIFDRQGWTMLSDIAIHSREDILKIDNFGRTSYAEIWAYCVGYGFWLLEDSRHLPVRVSSQFMTDCRNKALALRAQRSRA